MEKEKTKGVNRMSISLIETNGPACLEVQVSGKLARQAVARAGGRVEKDAGGEEVFVIPVQTPKPGALERSCEPGPAANVRFTAEEMSKITAGNSPGHMHAALNQFADRPQLVRLVTPGGCAGRLQLAAGVFLGQGEQALQDPHALDAPLGEHRFGPPRGLGSDHPDLLQQPLRAPFDSRDFFRSHVGRVRAKTAGFVPHVQGDLLEALVEDPHRLLIPTHPHFVAQILRRCRVISFGHLDVTVTVDATDDFAIVSAKIISVTSNEHSNPGQRGPDWEITGPLSVDLRAERSGRGNGRVYTITVECEDDGGNVTTGEVTVTVPKGHQPGEGMPSRGEDR